MQPYEGLAGIYDHVMRHVDYDAWAEYLDEILDRYSVHEPEALIDIACGTGSVALALCALGRPVVQGVDFSEAMLRVARERALLAGRDIAFQARDFRDLEGIGTFDTAVCMYDSMNYLMDRQELTLALRAVERILSPEGLFVFDVCTERNSLRYFQDMTEEESGPGFHYRRHSHYDPVSRLQVNDFVIHLQDLDTPLEEHHEQRIHRLADIRRAIGETGFLLLGAFDEFTFTPGTEESDRVHFVLRRGDAG